MNNEEAITFIKKIMKDKGMNPCELAKSAKMSPKTLYSWLNDTSVPSLANFIKLCKVLDIKVELKKDGIICDMSKSA